MSEPRRPATRVVRAGRRLPAGAGEPVTTPLVHSVAFAYGSAAEQDAVFANERPGYVYGRYGTPTTAALEEALAELEGLPRASCFVSGMSAIHALATETLFARGLRLVAQEDVYGQTRALFERLAREERAAIAFVDVTDHAAVEWALAAGGPALLYVEAIANPLLRVADLAALAALVHARGGLLAVDATFATPMLVRPAEHGADLVLHSLTKYLNGHGDVMGGVVSGPADWVAALVDRKILDGAYLPPHDAWLVLRGLRTLDVRMARHCESALAVAVHLAEQPKVARVHHPGLATHPQHALARRQFGGRFGAMVSFVLADGTRDGAFRFLDALALALPATTLGDVYTEVLYPPTSSHRRMPAEERARLGITDGFVRLSVGIEDPADIIADLDAALARV